jgi:hypothetical protein
MIGRRLALSVPAARRLAVAVAILGLAGAADAAKKQPPLVPDWKQSHFEEANPAVRSVYILAVCTRIHRREAAEALLATVPGSAEEASRLAAAVPSGPTECPIRSTKLTIHSKILMRGAIAEAIYNGEGAKPRSAAALPLAETFQPTDRGSAPAVARWVARCAVRRTPRLAHAVVKYNPGAVGERHALLALKPTFTACLPPGERLRVSRLEFRALIAEELHRASVSFKESFANAKS